jgi:hypothetical protein
MNSKHIRAILLAILLVLVTSAYQPFISVVLIKYDTNDVNFRLSHQEEIGLNATTTSSINLPIVEQNSPKTTAVPNNGNSEIANQTPGITATPTPTPIPPQSGSVNIPIVLGALVIITVVVFGWFFFSYLPKKKKV